jgi:hypothetical protein
MSLRFLTAIAGLAICAAAAPAQSPSPTPTSTANAKPAVPPPPTTDLVVAGRKLTDWILINQLDSVVAHLGPNVNADTTRAELSRLVEEIAIHGGSQVKVIDEKVVRRNGRYQYWRTAEFETAPSAVLLRIVVTPDGKYSGHGIGLANNAPPIDP